MKDLFKEFDIYLASKDLVPLSEKEKKLLARFMEFLKGRDNAAE